jgi:molybdenum cofactor biosynthesis protein MoaC
VDTHFEMVDVGPKAATHRRARARGSLRMGQKAFELLCAGKLPKGDALRLAEAAGLLSAKRTWETIPLCHPLALDKVGVWFELDPGLPGVHAYCEAQAEAKTGVEMEALCGVSGALLTVYDVVKQVDAALTIEDIRLELKVGGKSGVWTHPEAKAIHTPSPQPSPLKGEGEIKSFNPTRAERGANSSTPVSGEGKNSFSLSPGGRGSGEGEKSAAVITVSDRCYRKQAEDISGPLLAEGLREIGFKILPAKGKSLVTILPDEKEEIARALKALAAKADVVVLTGGTGLSPRDVTPEAVESVCDRMVVGIGEALRQAGAAATPMASLSRATAGQLGRCLVVALPGSPGAVKDGLRVLAEILPHAVHIGRNGKHSN